MLAMLPTIYAGMEREERIMRAYLAAPSSLSLGRKRRRAVIEQAFGPALKALSSADRNQVLAVLQLFTSARTWQHFREVWGLSGKDAGSAAHWAMSALLAAAKTRPPSQVTLPPPVNPKERK